MLPIYDQLFLTRPTWQRVVNFLFAPSAMLLVLFLATSIDTPLAFGVKSITRVFFFLFDQAEREEFIRSSDTSVLLVAWLFFFSYFIFMWWLIIGAGTQRQNKTLEEGSYPGIFFSFRYLMRLTLWEAVQIVFTIMFMSFIFVAVVTVLQGIIVLVFNTLGGKVSTGVFQSVAMCEMWLLSILLFLAAYGMHGKFCQQIADQAEQIDAPRGAN